MAVRARQHIYYQQPAVPYEQPTIQPKQYQPKKRKVITAGEKFLYIVFIVLVAALSIVILHKQSIIQETTIEIQDINEQIAEIEKDNVDLKVRVNELSSYDRIWERAQSLGLTLKEDNVKVVPGE
ncbi:MAG: cell division protein FtsL [Lysinibacillus sp.]|nr:cell division protein FtsL [Lysinibacillus sp.]